MKIWQVTKRITLLLLVNLLVMLTIGIIAGLLFRGPLRRSAGMSICFCSALSGAWAGAFISLALSRSWPR